MSASKIPASNIPARTILLRAAKHMEKHGFHPEWNEFSAGGKSRDCGCFLHAMDYSHSSDAERLKAQRLLGTVVAGPTPAGGWFFGSDLRRMGWIKGQTKDAVAALRIAADLAA